MTQLAEASKTALDQFINKNPEDAAVPEGLPSLTRYSLADVEG